MSTTILGTLFPEFINNFFEVLAIPLVKTPFVEIHYGWGLVHFVLSFILMFFILKDEEENPILLLLGILVLFEIFEFTISYLLPIILKETLADTLWDLVIGFAGGMFAFAIFRDR